MMKTDTILNEWDLLADRFDTYKAKYDVHPDAAINAYVGWPTFFQQISVQCEYLGTEKLNILDFGCGAGELCNILSEKGHVVTGTDQSNGMRNLAKKNLTENINLLSQEEFLHPQFQEEHKGSFDVITSMHVMDWIEDIEDTLETLTSLVKKDGILLFSVFPKQHVKEDIALKNLFEDFDSDEDPKVGYANFDGVRVPVFVREASFYDGYFSSNKWNKVLEYYPPYPKEFFEKYEWTSSLFPEMTILAYRK